ncbi:MAG: hypothetical protein ABH852_04845 [Methanobacteriota archaeon]
MRKVAIVLPVMILALALAPLCRGTPGTFSQRGGEIYDNWDLCRTRSWENDGFFQGSETSFRPAIAFESLGELRDVAWQIGQQMAGQYIDRNQLAEQIFFHVRNHVAYTSDLDQFGMEEFAQNADELAEEIETQGFARGDCEDDAILLAVMFRAAGFRSAVVLVPEHVAVVVHLPNYSKANTFWNFKETGGWVWAEATGRTNPLGWTPPEYINADLAAYEVTEENSIFESRRAEVPTSSEESPIINYLPFISIIFFFRFFCLLSTPRRK